MTIRFLQTVASEHPEFPFMAGQVIEVACPSPYLLELLDGVRAEVVRTDASERAIAAPDAIPEPVAVKSTRKRHAKHARV